MLLLGLMAQASGDNTYSIEVQDNAFVARADKLLREFHDRIILEYPPILEQQSTTLKEKPEAIGLLAREAIYYEPESFYIHQFSKFSRHRYRDDAIWLLQNAGLSIRPMIDIAKFIFDRTNQQMNSVGYMRQEGIQLSHGELTNSLLILKSDIRKSLEKKRTPS